MMWIFLRYCTAFYESKVQNSMLNWSNNKRKGNQLSPSFIHCTVPFVFRSRPFNTHLRLFKTFKNEIILMYLQPVGLIFMYYKTSGFKTSGFKTSGFKASGLQNIRFTKCQVSKRLFTKRPVFEFDILIKQKV